GSTVRMQGQPVTIIGIAPPAFYGGRASATPPAFWLPLSSEPLLRQASSVLHQPIACWLYVIGRIPEGVSQPALAQKISANLRAWLMSQDEYRVHGFTAKIAKVHVVLAPGGSGIRKLQQETGSQLRLLQSISALLLLVACANVANLMLGRGLRRRIEISVRMALGSARMRLVRQMLTESIVLGGVGGIAGITLAYLGTRMIVALAFPEALHSSFSATPSLPVLSFACALAIFTGIAFGILPAWLASNQDPALALRGAGRAVSSGSVLPQRMLLVFQIAFSLVLLVAALMLTRSLANSESEDIGIHADHRYVLSLDPASAGYAPDRLDALHRTLETRLQALPGVRSVGLAMYSPLDGGIWVDGVSLPERPSLGDNEDNDVLLDRVSPHFLAAVGQPVVLGRGIEASDTASTPLIAVVNQAFVRKYLPRGNPIGRRFGLYEHEDVGAYEVVGVVADAKYTDAQSPAQPMAFEPLAQWQRQLQDPIFINLETQTHFIGAVVLQYDGPPAAIEPAVRATLAGIDPNLAVIQFRTLSAQLSANFSQERLVARLASLFALLALVLTGVGLYGITSYQAAQRTREIGLRMAFGAGWRRIVVALTASALRDLGVGLVVGIPAALLAARLVQSELYHVSPFDPASLVSAVAILSLAALVAGVIPACRAAFLDPMQALRSE
ncbi:FtsX-like permease family protein, partial [Silvibacterium sp.]|uniref:FtsX-like permease family protein n=1 Tax=Silvibacterium sp. TaxID=1964179 RepID=UPI0039E603E0